MNVSHETVEAAVAPFYDWLRAQGFEDVPNRVPRFYLTVVPYRIGLYVSGMRRPIHGDMICERRDSFRIRFIREGGKWGSVQAEECGECRTLHHLPALLARFQSAVEQQIAIARREAAALQAQPA